MAKNVKIIVSLVVVVVILVAVGKYLSSKDVYEVAVGERFANIEWGTPEEQVKEKIQSAGYQLVDKHKLVVFTFSDYGGVAGATGKGAVQFNKERKMEGVICYFKKKEMDEKVLNKLAKSLIKEFDEIFPAKMTKKEIIKALDLGMSGKDVLMGDTHIIWMGEESMVTLMYTKSEFITISYETIDSEYAQFMHAAYLQY